MMTITLINEVLSNYSTTVYYKSIKWSGLEANFKKVRFKLSQSRLVSIDCRETRVVTSCGQLLQFGVLTLEEFRSSIRRTATERVEFASRLELVAEAKVGNLNVQVAIEQQIFCLSTTK